MGAEIPVGCVSLYGNGVVYVPSFFPLEGPMMGVILDADMELRIWSTHYATTADGDKTKKPTWHVPHGARINIANVLRSCKKTPKHGYYKGEMIDGVLCVDLGCKPLPQKQRSKI